MKGTLYLRACVISTSARLSGGTAQSAASLAPRNSAASPSSRLLASRTVALRNTRSVLITHALTFSLIFSLPSLAWAEDFYIDPDRGRIGNDGSSDQPWSTLQEVIEAGRIGTVVKAGDRLLLRSGYHGEMELDSGAYTPPITIVSESSQRARLRRIYLHGTSGLVVQGVSISPSHAPSYEKTTLVEIGEGSTDITIENCELFSVDDATGWGADAWINDASNGFRVDGADVTVKDNTIRNVRFGISVQGEDALVEHNTIDGFSADGIRGLGDYGIYQYNIIKNVYVDGDLDENHDDGFQSWTVGPDGVGTGEVRGVVLRGNLILNNEDPNQPFRATLQGIGCFDGTFVDWVVENNIVITDHWHGISLYGARDSRIVNNTVLDVNDERPGPPWISFHEHKDGTAPQNCVVRNNLATDYANASTGVIEDHNSVIEDPAALFVDPVAHDLRLLPDAPVIDQGSSELAPELDADGVSRPQGQGIDLGAYEWHDPSVVVHDAGMSLDSGTEPDSRTEMTLDSSRANSSNGDDGDGGSTTGDKSPDGDGGRSGSATDTTSTTSSGGVGESSIDTTSSDAMPEQTPSSSDDSGGCSCRISQRGNRPLSPTGRFVLTTVLLLMWFARRRVMSKT